MAKFGQKFAASVSGDCGALVSVGVDGKRAGIDPISIATVITTLLPMIAEWFKACREKRQQRQQDQKQIQDSLKKIKTLSTKTEPQNRVALMQEIHRVRQRLRGKNRTLDRQLSQLANDAQKNVVSVHSGARQAVRGILDLLQTANSPRQC